MASLQGNISPQEQERLLSTGQSSKVPVVSTSSISPTTGTDPRPRNPRSAKPPGSPGGTFHQYELIDLEALMPAASNSSPGGFDLKSPSDSCGSDRADSKTPLFGESDTDALLASFGKPVVASRPRDTPQTVGQAGMLPRSGRGAVAPREGDRLNDAFINTPGAAYTAGRGEGIPPQPVAVSRPHSYSLPDHNCQIRLGANGNSHTTKAAVCRAPVPVPRSKLDSSAGASQSQPQASSSASASSVPTPQASSTVITKQPGTEETQSTEQNDGTSAASNADTKSKNASSSKKDDNEKSKKAKEAKAKTAEVNAIPQTNFMIGLLVTCCFNPPLGIVAMIISLRAAAAYRDGDNKKGAWRARTSIIVSLFSIMLTMVAVSTLLVYTAVDRHGYGRKRDSSKKSSPFGF